MLIKILIYLIVFGGVFYLANSYYHFLDFFLQRWQDKRREKVTPRIDRMLLDIPLKKLLLIDVLTPIISGGVGFMLTHHLGFTLGFAALGLFLPIFIVKKLEQARRRKFASQLVDGLMLLSSSLKAGLSLLQAFEALVEEMPVPISKEFSLVIRQIQMGVTLEEAMYTLKARMRVDELDMVVTAIMVARETGGNLTDIFTQVANTIQERNKLIGRVNALCVQGKLQGVIMSLLPILFGLFVYQTNPHFFDLFLQERLGRFLLAYAFVSEAVGIFFIRKLSRIDI